MKLLYITEKGINGWLSLVEDSDYESLISLVEDFES